jgi:hypothetical protein
MFPKVLKRINTIKYKDSSTKTWSFIKSQFTTPNMLWHIQILTQQKQDREFNLTNIELLIASIVLPTLGWDTTSLENEFRRK